MLLGSLQGASLGMGIGVGVDGGLGGRFDALVDTLEPMQADGTFKPLPPLPSFEALAVMNNGGSSGSGSSGARSLQAPAAMRRPPPGFSGVKPVPANAALAASAAVGGGGEAENDDDDVEDEQIMIGSLADASAPAPPAVATDAAAQAVPALSFGNESSFLNGLDATIAQIPMLQSHGAAVGGNRAPAPAEGIGGVAPWPTAAFGNSPGVGGSSVNSLLPVPGAFMSAPTAPVPVQPHSMAGFYEAPSFATEMGSSGTALTDLVADATAEMQQMMKTAGDR